ncbi:hypothetical protein [Kocuria sp. CPCC 205263]|uniref:hypothetical protein n=1 Tax=Kocuria sp. CPCC 205263 TaxID=3073555 RepID=UPI0034D637AC
MSTSISPRELLRDPPRRPRYRRTIAASAVLMLGFTGISASVAATQVTEKNPGQLTAVGPVNPEFGFPAWYEDSAGVRTELCIDGSDPLCGLAPEPETPYDPTQPTVLPGNFPHEGFYMLAGSELDLPGGGSAVLTLGLEGAFANEVAHGEQMVFARQRLVVKEGPANSTLSFQHPYGTIEVDTDEAGDAKLVEDISPAVGNFETPLKSNFGPFLKWDSGAPDGYLGNPDVPHTVVGSPLGEGRNSFSVSGTNSATGDAVTARTDLFTVMGKIATNHGVKAEHAVVNDGYIDVFATSRGDQLQVNGQEGVFETTPMEKDEGDSEQAYARIAYTGTAPSTVTVTNLGDDPQSTSTVNVTDLSVGTAATYDGAILTVTARSSSGTAPTVRGFGELTAGAAGTYEGTFTTVAPPVNVTVSTSDTSKVTVPVFVTGGEASPAGLAPIDANPDPGGVTVVEGGTGTTPPAEGGTDPAPAADAVIAPVTGAMARGVATELDGSGSTGATSYTWSQVSGPTVTFSDPTVAKPTVTVPFFTTTTASAPEPADEDPVLKLVVTNADGVEDEAQIRLRSDDDVSIAPGARYRAGKEFRIAGTAVVEGSPTLLRPPSSVNVYDVAADGTFKRKLGTAQVDTLGNWELRLRPAPAGTVTNVLVQSTRGGEATGAVGG